MSKETTRAREPPGLLRFCRVPRYCTRNRLRSHVRPEGGNRRGGFGAGDDAPGLEGAPFAGKEEPEGDRERGRVVARGLPGEVREILAPRSPARGVVRVRSQVLESPRKHVRQFQSVDERRRLKH